MTFTGKVGVITGAGSGIGRATARLVRAVRGETTDYPTFRDGAAVQGVVDAVDLSARERRWIGIAP